MSVKIEVHGVLEVYRMAFAAAMRIFELTRKFPKEEVYSLTDQIRRSSDHILGKLVNMITHPEQWTISR
jgi:hypothetical protein